MKPCATQPVTLDREEAERLFKQYTPLAVKLSDSYSDKYQCPYYFVREIAMDILADMAVRWNDPTDYRRFQPEKAKEKTWMQSCLQWGLDEVLDTRRKKNQTLFIEEVESEGNFRIAHFRTDSLRKKGFQHLIDRLFHELSTDAAEIIKAVFAAPGDVLDGFVMKNNTPERAKKAAVMVGLDQGWDYVRFQQAWDEISKAI